MQDIKAGPNSTLLYKVPSNYTGKDFVTNVPILFLLVEFITKYFKEVFDPRIEVNLVLRI